MNDITVNQMKTNECQKYLGQDENILYVGPINKDRVMKEYTKSMEKILASELSAYNVHSATNKGWSTVNYCQSSAFDCPYLSCNDHCDQ